MDKRAADGSVAVMEQLRDWGMSEGEICELAGQFAPRVRLHERLKQAVNDNGQFGGGA